MKRSLPVFFTLLLTVLIGASAHGQLPVYTSEPSGEFLKDWLLCGPIPLQKVNEAYPDDQHLPGFDLDHLKNSGGETAPQFRKALPSASPAARRSGRAIAPKPGKSASTQPSPATTHVAAYAYCEIEARHPRICVLAFGSNDGARVWLNGEQILDHPEARGLSIDDDIIPVGLRKGRNTLLIKVEERGNRWGFCARFLPFDSRDLVDPSALFRVRNRQDGSAQLRFAKPLSAMTLIWKHAAIEVAPRSQPGKAVWKTKWNKRKEIPLDLPEDAYGEYLLSVEAEFMDGTTTRFEMPFTAGRREEHTLFENGKTGYAIVVGAEASESEQWAAQELQHWLKEVSGAEFPLRSDADPAAPQEIVVGFNKRTRKLLGAKVSRPDDGDESFIYLNAGPAIVIQGGRDRGTMYGVMTFLERELGVRWYTPTISVAPKKERFAFVHLHHTESPGIRVRNDFYYEAFDPIWAARQKVNGAMGLREQPGGVESYWSVHTFYRFMPPEEFFDDHPEYYSLIEGERRHERTQLCLTNPDVLRIVTERVSDVMRKEPGHLIYSVSQNDWRNPCECDKCQAIAKREESESGPLIWFVNQVAEAVGKEFPDKYIGTLAYQYTRKPCKTLRPRENVVVRFCSIECCFAHDFLTCPENATFVDDIKGWAAIAPHIYIWDYVVNFSHYIMPYPNFRVLQVQHQDLPRQQRHRHHGTSRLSEPGRRVRRTPRLRAGQVAVESRVRRRTRNQRLHVRLLRPRRTARPPLLRPPPRPTHARNPHPPSAFPRMTRYSPTSSSAMPRKIFDEAEAVAGDEEIRKRVEMARLPIMYLKCLRNPGEAKYDGTYARFSAIVKREGPSPTTPNAAPPTAKPSTKKWTPWNSGISIGPDEPVVQPHVVRQQIGRAILQRIAVSARIESATGHPPTNGNGVRRWEAPYRPRGGRIPPRRPVRACTPGNGTTSVRWLFVWRQLSRSSG